MTGNDTAFSDLWGKDRRLDMATSGRFAHRGNAKSRKLVHE
jgi:hypothetical protein